MASSPKLAEQIFLRQRLMDISLSHSSTVHYSTPTYPCKKLTKTGIYEMIVKSQERKYGPSKFPPSITEQVSLRLEAIVNKFPILTLTVTHYERIHRVQGSPDHTRIRAWMRMTKWMCSCSGIILTDDGLARFFQQGSRKPSSCIEWLLLPMARYAGGHPRLHLLSGAAMSSKITPFEAAVLYYWRLRSRSSVLRIRKCL